MIDKATSLMRHGGLDDPSPLIDAVLAMADGGKPPPLTSWISEAAIAY